MSSRRIVRPLKSFTSGWRLVQSQGFYDGGYVLIKEPSNGTLTSTLFLLESQASLKKALLLRLACVSLGISLGSLLEAMWPRGKASSSSSKKVSTASP